MNFHERSGTLQGLYIIGTVCALLVGAFALVESVNLANIQFEFILIALLILPAICLPALAFNAHAREKRRNAELIDDQADHMLEVLENMNLGVCMFDGSQQLVVSNKRYAEMYGLSEEQVKPGTMFRDILEDRVNQGTYSGEERIAYIEERMSAVRERHKSTKIQELSDGRWVSIAHCPMSDGGWLATHDDITEQKKSEIALMQSEARFRAVFDNSPFCLNLKDAEGHYLFANKQYEDWWGRSIEEVVGKKAVEFDKDAERLQVLTESEKIVLETGETHESEIHVKRPRDGEPRDRWLIKFPVNAPNGEVLGLGTFAADITDRKRAEEELAKHRENLEKLYIKLENEQQRLEQIYRNTPVMLHSIREDGEIVEVSEYWCEKLGYEREEVLNKSIYDFMSDDSADYMRRVNAPKLFSGGSVDNQHYTYKKKDGTDMEVRLSAITGRGTDGEKLQTFSVVFDVTDEMQAKKELTEHRNKLQKMIDEATLELKEKAAELESALGKEKELNELQRQFVSMASHEFRTPLAIIDSSAQRLKKRSDSLSSEDAQQRIDRIRTAVQRMMRLMESTLTAARMEEGKVNIEPEECDIQSIVSEACIRLQEISESHVITCELESLPSTIRADAAALEQVLNNLITNAVKYSPQSPYIRVSARGEGDKVLISVEDKGLGIDEDDLPMMFGRFFRAKTSTGITGTGIGLNLVKTLVELHDGAISVSSKKGEGSTFTVALPVAGPAPESANEQDDVKVA